MTVIEKLARKFAAVLPVLSERGRRLWAGAEADALGRGGVAWVAKATGLAISTVRKGRDEVRAGVTPELVRDRRPGGGRTRLEEKDPQLKAALEALVAPSTRGDPEGPLRWTLKSTRVLAAELTRQGHRIGSDTVGQLLRQAGYSLQANAKTKEGSSHPDRDAQFRLINEKAQQFIGQGLPVISVDAKKRELIGEHSNAGREWQPKGKAVEVLSHDFVAATSPRAIPYGVYDVAKNVGFVNVGTDHNTPSFAVRSIEKWWDQMGAQRYPQAKRLFIMADAGGSNATRSRLWKLKLQDVANRTGLTIHVSHFPPGTSKWNKIEHRLFSFISINWRGHPLTTYETIVSLIAGTKTSKGLTVQAELDTDKYPLGLEASAQALKEMRLENAAFRGEWNYTLHPRSPESDALLQPSTRAVKHRGSHAETRARWMKLFAEQQLSGLSNPAFCKARNVNHSSYLRARALAFGPAPRTGRRITPEAVKGWLKLFSEHERSGLSQRAFCRERGLNFDKFSRERRLIIGPIRPRKRSAQ